MDTPTNSLNTSTDQDSIVVDDSIIINNFSKLLTDLKSPDTLRKLLSILEGKLEETLSQHGECDTDSEFRTPDYKVIVPVTPKYRVGVKNLPAGTLLNVSSGSETSNTICSPSPVKYFSPYVELIRDLVFNDSLVNSVHEEAKSLCPNPSIPSNKVKYTWLSTENIPYVFSRVYHPAIDITQYENIATLMRTLDTQTGNYGLDSCLIAYYDNGAVSLNPHADDEPEIDQTAPIVILSFGPPRVMRFCNKSTRQQIGSMELTDCSIVVMKPGCQQELVHEVVQSANTSGPEGSRISLSFRKVMKPQLLTGTIAVKAPSESSIDINDSLPRSTFPQMSTPYRPLHKVPQLIHNDGYQEPTLDTTGSKSCTVPSEHGPSPRHLVIGDSLIRNVKLPNSITICKGGAKPRDLIAHIRREGITCQHYQFIETITICCGTNSVGNPYIDMESIKSDYDMLLREIIGLFPNARIALFNIPPRSYSTPIVVDRIFEFNNFLFHISQSCYPNISFINLFREFILPNGYLNKQFYIWDYLHFDLRGYDIVMDRISHFQRYREYFS